MAEEEVVTRGGPPAGLALTLLATLVVIGAIVAFAIVNGRGSSRSNAPSVTVPTASVPTVSAPTGATPATTTATDTAPTTTTAAAQADDWPAGTTAYTVVLTSIPKTGNRLQDARRVADGLSGVSAGVLDSSSYSTLRPGWWVVYTGQYDTLAAASAAAARLRADGHRDAYARWIAPR